MKSNIGPGAAAAIIVVVALVVVGLLWKVYFSGPPNSSGAGPYKNGPAGMKQGQPPPTVYNNPNAGRPMGPGGPGMPPGGGAPGGMLGTSGGPPPGGPGGQ